MAEITEADLFECTVLAYRKWSEAYDALKKVKQETNDGSQDWALFHKARLENTGADEAKWDALVKRLQAARMLAKT